MEKICRYFTGIKRRKGQGMTEYIIIVGLIALAAIVVVALFGKQIKAQFAGMTGAMSGQNVVVDNKAATDAAKEDDTAGSLKQYKGQS
ncbi:MAG: hypothetical protein ACD_79C01234G0005 [uncultured bacterium]|nr:MAG: hypothetical protein ACD_79C01234G0005 [uncultured bacterium]